MAAAGEMGNFGKAYRAKVPGDGKHPQQESGITDTVHDKRFVGGGARRFAMEIESDQQIRTQPHAFPTHKHQRVVIPQNKGQHGEHEEIEVSEKSVVPALMRHIAGGINMDERAHSGYEQQPYAGERIKQKTGICLKRRRGAVAPDVIHMAGIGAQPGVDDFLERLPGIVVGVVRVLPHRDAGKQEGQGHRADTNCIDRRLPQPAAEKKHDGRAKGGKQRDEPDVFEKEHCPQLLASSHSLPARS